ncbi:hypothetical protein QOT17_001724 [Balamuthia mandrillaris]
MAHAHWLLLSLGFCLVVALPFSCDALVRSYQNCVELRKQQEHGAVMRLHWNIREDDSNSNDNGNDNRTLELALESSARGWSAIGISTDGTMTSSGEGSDVMLGWISDPVDGGEGSAVEQSKRQDEQEDCSSGCINDYWVETKFPNPPVKMDEQWGEGGRPNLLLVAAEEADGMTIFEWDRPLDTGDVVADRVIDPSVETFGKLFSCYSKRQEKELTQILFLLFCFVQMFIRQSFLRPTKKKSPRTARSSFSILA